MAQKMWEKLDQAIKNKQKQFTYDLSSLNPKDVIPTFQKLKNQGYDVEIETENGKDCFTMSLSNKVENVKVDFSMFKKKENAVAYKTEENLIIPNFKGVQ